MATLDFSDGDLIKLRASWGEVMAQKKTSTAFARTAFSKMFVTNPELKPAFADPVVYSDQQQLFGELLNFTMMYLHNEGMLSECTDEFLKENPALVTLGALYLEPMGAVMISTLRDVLGNTFHSGLETLWIKVYVYIANCILHNDESDTDLMISTSNMSSVSEEDIRPLNVRPPILAPAQQPGATLNVDLSSNAKYRGFRRSGSELHTSSVQVKTPSISLDSKVATGRNRSVSPRDYSFDPRSDRNEPVLTPRSVLRNSSAQFQELGLDTSSLCRSDSVASSSLTSPASSASSTSSFDPRRKCHRRTPSDLSLNMDVPSVSGYNDVDNEFYDDSQINFSQSVKYSPVFDSNSFGIKGLAPIVESERDDDSHYSDQSSRYNEKTSEDEYSSRTSSFSLHNVDRKSSISSGSTHSPIVGKQHKQTDNDVSSISAFDNPYPMLSRAFSSSLPLFSSKYGSGQRASLGFMRSSFILKKEMQEMGYNEPENVAVHPPVHVSLPRVNVSLSRSVASLPLPSTSYKKLPIVPVAKTSIPKQQKDELPKKEHKSLRRKLSLIFGLSTRKTLLVAGTISAPILDTRTCTKTTTHTKLVATVVTLLSLRASVAPSTTGSVRSASNRLSSLDLRLAPMKPSREYGAPLHLRNTSDTASVKSSTSSKNSFFSFKSLPQVKYHDDGLDRKANKYLVQKVPYKTIYVKDLIRL